MIIQINVDNNDINIGKNHAGEYNSCPIAQSLLRSGYTNIDVDEDRILLTKHIEILVGEAPTNAILYIPERFIGITPKNASIFIDDFDHNSKQDKNIKPISFMLNLKKATVDDERKPIGAVNKYLSTI